MSRPLRMLWICLGALLVALIMLPMVGLVAALRPTDFAAGVQHPLLAPALWLSLQTTLLSVALIIATGTPLAWWLATSSHRWTRLVQLLVDVPLVVPPAVMGIALLTAFGRNGLLGSALSGVGLQVPFTTTAVVIAQVVVCSPFYVHSAVAGFRKVDPDVLLVARTLGATSIRALWRVAIPVALPALVAGGAMAWARAVGEFGATLLFAGSLAGKTQTMPLAIYAALEVDVRVALALALILTGASLLLLFPIRRRLAS